MPTLEDFEFRAVDTANSAEFRRFLRLFWDIPGALDPRFERPGDAFIEQWMKSARQNETEQNTYSGVALRQGSIVGLHLLRRFEEGSRVGAHAAGLWVDPSHRGIGIARRLKQDGEAWARRIGARFINTNVHVENSRMLEINQRAGFRPYRLNMRKELR